jgi:hypothetical protein
MSFPASLLTASANILDTVRGFVRNGEPPHALAQHWRNRLERLPHHCNESRGGCTQVAFLHQAQQEINAVLSHAQQCTDLQLLIGLLPIVQHAIPQLHALHRKVRYLHRERVQRRPFDPAMCGDAPFRDRIREGLHVVDASSHSRPSRTGKVYDFLHVEPFVSSSLRKSRRASLYSHLQPKRLTLRDMWRPDERTLIGQWGLFASAAIPAGTCIGVCGGQLLDHHDFALLDDSRYLIEASGSQDAGTTVAINGEGLLSLSNTLLLLNNQGQIVGHPAEGYNIEVARFPARLSGGWDSFAIPAMFTLHDIAPGEELRWHYGLSIVQYAEDASTLRELQAIA